MKKLLLYGLFLNLSFIYSIFGQSKFELKVVSDSNDPIENAIILNVSNNKFYYSDSIGVTKIEYLSEIDSFKVIIPTFYETYFTIKEIKGKSSTIELKPKITQLKEVIVTSKNQKYKKLNSFKIESKKKYFSSHISTGGSIASEFYFNEKGKKKINSISFYFKVTDENIKIRPLLYKLVNNNWEPILETANTISINKDSEELNINLEKFNIYLNPKNKYIIGFELIDKNKVSTTEVLSISKKNLISYLKSKPNSKWFRIQEKDPNFSIYYEIYFSE